MAVLFLYRPRQTYMQFRRPRPYTQQDAYNLELQRQFDATRRAAAPAPAQAVGSSDPLADLKELGHLHATGVLDNAEFAAAKAKIIGTQGGSS
jgi:hypothetical protein